MTHRSEQLPLPLPWFLIVPKAYDSARPGEGLLVQAWDADDAVRELGMGPVESVMIETEHGVFRSMDLPEQAPRVNT